MAALTDLAECYPWTLHRKGPALQVGHQSGNPPNHLNLGGRARVLPICQVKVIIDHRLGPICQVLACQIDMGYLELSRIPQTSHL